MITLTPGPGRDYKSKGEVLADFDAEKDFIVNDMSNPWDGKPCNKSSLAREGERQVQFRYAKLRKTFVHKL